METPELIELSQQSWKNTLAELEKYICFKFISTPSDNMKF